MKINPVMAQDAILKYKRVENKMSEGASGLNYSDSVVLSEGAQKFSSVIRGIREELEGADATREGERAERIAGLAAAISEDSYEVDYQLVSARMFLLP